MRTPAKISAQLATALTLAWLGALSAVAQVSYTYSPSGNLAALLATNAAPQLVSQPRSQLAQPNSVVSLSFVAFGAGLSYQWLSNGVPILGAIGDSLVLANLPLVGTNLGNFSVVVSNAYGAITSAPTALWPDANNNGIPDWWEMKYFGNLNQLALGDYDGDGVDNLHEYLEGTDPTNRQSFNPRLNVLAARGTVSAFPSLPYYTKGQLVTLVAVPDAGQGFVSWSGAVSGTKSSISLFMNTNESITANFGLPLGVALDNTNLVWTTSGNALWFGQTEFSQDGMGSAQSGPIVSYWNGGNFVGDQTMLQTTIYLAQPQQLSFWWSVSSQPPDGVTFSINSNVVASLSGESVAWQNIQTNLPSGACTLTWTYSKGPVDIPDGIPYFDAAWVDQVTFTPLTATLPVAPVLGIQLARPNSVLLYWPVSSNVFRLQQTATLRPANWTNTTNAVSVVNGNNQATVTGAVNSQFYRLVYP
jgi:Divergent InlB B-repeat domain